MRASFNLVAFLCLGASLNNAADFTWTGMRNPCKLSAEDGLNEKQLAKKIGTFILQRNPEDWAQAIFNVNNRFPGSKPWVTWGVGKVRDAEEMSDADHQKCLSEMDRLGVDVFVEIAPEKSDDVLAILEKWNGKFKQHPSIKGFSVDLEFFRPATDEMAQAWDEKIKSLNPNYRLMLKHWEDRFMPPKYRGKGDLIYTNTSSEASIDALNSGFAKWAQRFYPSAVAFQIGYPADEDGLDGTAKTGWWKLKDPIKDWGTSLLAGMKNPDQQIGLLWVCAKSGKTYNATWDITRGAKVPK
jgi:hypothetical protein